MCISYSGKRYVDKLNYIYMHTQRQTHFHTWAPHLVGGSSCSEFPGLNSEDGTLFGLTKPPLCHVPSPWWSVAQSPRQPASVMTRSHSSSPALKPNHHVRDGQEHREGRQGRCHWEVTASQASPPPLWPQLVTLFLTLFVCCISNFTNI